MDVFDAHDAKATVSACGRTVERTPEVTREESRAGSPRDDWRWEGHAGMSEEVERERIARTVPAIAKAVAYAFTRRLLIEEGGFLNDSDGCNDDMPYVAGAAERPHVVPLSGAVLAGSD